MYASALIDAAAAMSNQWPARPSIDPSSKPSEIPLRLRGAIGAMLKRGEPITAIGRLHGTWLRLNFVAYACSALLSRVRLYYTSNASRPNFRAVSFFVRRAAIFRFVIAPPVARFTVTLRGDFETLPDIVSLTAPLSEVDRVVTECTEALEPYSRLIGRDPSARGTLAAELSLPKELLQRPQAGGAAAKRASNSKHWYQSRRRWCRLMSLMSLLQIRAKSDNKNSKSETIAVAAALENLGFAMEPDPRHGGRSQRVTPR